MITVSAEAWHDVLYLITPLQYSQRLGMLFYILSRLGSISWAFARYSISYHALAVSAEAWHAVLYNITPLQYPPRLGILFNILSRLGSICRRIKPLKPELRQLKTTEQTTSRTPGPGLRKPELRKPELQKLKFNKQRHAGMWEWAKGALWIC